MKQNKQLREQATQLRKEGHSYRHIEEETGISKSTLQRFLSKITPTSPPPTIPSISSATNKRQQPKRGTTPDRIPTPNNQPPNRLATLEHNIAQKQYHLGALTNEVATKERQLADLNGLLAHQRHEMSQLQQYLTQTRLEWEGLRHDLLNLPIQQEALLRQQQQLDYDRQRFEQLLAKTRPQMEAYQTFRIRYGGEWMVAQYNALIEEVINRSHQEQWPANALIDILERSKALRQRVLGFCDQNALLPGTLMIMEGLDFMWCDLEEAYEQAYKQTKGLFGASWLKIQFNDSDRRRYRGYLVTEIAQPKLFVSMSLPLIG